jgi:hypothetical protein
MYAILLNKHKTKFGGKSGCAATSASIMTADGNMNGGNAIMVSFGFPDILSLAQTIRIVGTMVLTLF